MNTIMKALTKTFFTAIVTFLFAATAFANIDGDKDVRSINVTGNDNMKFDVSLIEAEAGETIEIVFKTKSDMPKNAMAHNIAIIDLGVDLEEFVMASIAAADNEYIAPAFEDQVIANTEMIGGGETSTIEFTVPDTPGDYDFVCTFPGHYQAGMTGILRVK